MRLLLMVLISFIHSCEGSDTQKPASKKPIQVLVKRVEETILSNPLTFGGILEPSVKVHLYGKNSGVIEKVYPNLGDSLKKGDKVFLIEPQKVGFQKFILKSPLEGVFVESYVEEGELISGNQKLAQLAQLDSFAVTTWASLEDMKYLEVGSRLKVSLGSSFEKVQSQLQGEVQAISPIVDSKLGAFKVQVGLNCKKGQSGCQKFLRAGTFAELTLETRKRKGVQVPSKFLRKSRTKAILLNGESEVSWVDVKVGEVFGEATEVLEGLKEGDLIVTSFSRAPKDGEKVLVQEL